MAKKIDKTIEICSAGSNSVKGTIFEEYGLDVLRNANDYRWIIFTNYNTFGMIENECESMELDSYIIGNREGMIVSGAK